MAAVRRVVVCGAADAGKSTLIGRFLYDAGALPGSAVARIRRSVVRSGEGFPFASLLDSFEEERTGNLTIDTTQAYCRMKRGEDIVFIDVPGHRQLVENMLCGSSCADQALLVVSAREAGLPEMLRHARTLAFLGMDPVVVALNQMDALGFSRESFQEASGRLRQALAGVPLGVALIVPVCATAGDHLLARSARMRWYRGPALAAALQADGGSAGRRAGGAGRRLPALRFPVQDVYRPRGRTLAAGMIVNGRVRRGERVRILPDGEAATIRAIRDFEREPAMAVSPACVGLDLGTKVALRRGQVICGKPLPQVSDRFCCRLFCLQPLPAGAGGSGRLTVRCASQESPCRMIRVREVRSCDDGEVRLRRGRLEEGDIALVVIETGDRLVLERFEDSAVLGRCALFRDGRICGLGIVLQADPFFPDGRQAP